MSKIKSNIEKRDLIEIKPIEEKIDAKQGRRRSREKTTLSMVRIPFVYKELAKTFGHYQKKTLEEFLTDLIDEHCQEKRPDVYKAIKKMYKDF